LRDYECMLILSAEADEATVSTATDRIEKVATKHSGQVRGVDRWGRRRLAYEIDRANEAYYVVVTFSAEPAAQGELDRTLNLADEVLRYKTVVLPPKREKTEKKAEERAEPKAEPKAEPQPDRRSEPQAEPQLETSPAAVGGATPQGE
jgi:small subunit ribosomal protein S6